jgi:hypothetical protein
MAIIDDSIFEQERAKHHLDNPYPSSVFTTAEDRTITVDQWYPLQTISPIFLGWADGVETIIRFACGDGGAEYRVIGLDKSGQNLVCAFVKTFIDEAQEA